MISAEVAQLFKQTKSRLGAPIRKIQLTDDQMCDLLQSAVGDYSRFVQSFIIQSQWMNMYGKDMSSTDITYMLTIRTMDLALDYEDWFSKQVGLQQHGNFELKKDFFKVIPGQQCYVVPKGREICDVLYVTPTTSNVGLMGTSGFGGAFFGMPMGMAQLGGAMSYAGGLAAGYVAPLADSVMLAQDLKLKNQMFIGDLCYKVTAGPDGTHIIHLLSTPGSRKTWGGLSVDDRYGWGRYRDCNVWYTYYEPGGNVDECRKLNKNIIISPDQVPMEEMQYEYLNNTSKQYVKDMFAAECMITLGFTRGTFSGKVQVPEAEVNMDYNMFINQGEKLKDKTQESIKAYLEGLDPANVLKKQADISENVNKIASYTPLPFYLK